MRFSFCNFQAKPLENLDQKFQKSRKKISKNFEKFEIEFFLLISNQI